jgi:putative sigma-54 modulation protein
MDVIIQSLGFTAGEELENYVREKLSKLTPAEQIIRANVTMYVGADKNMADTFCEIRLEVPGNDLFVKESAKDNFEQAVDTTVNKLQNILRKQKEKQVDQWHRRSTT